MSSPPTQPSRSPQGPFLARRVRWEWHDRVRIDILDDRDQPVVTLDEWQTLVFHEADGNHTLEAIIAEYPSYYQDPQKVPADYRGEITRAAGSLVDERHWVERWDRADDLAHEVALPRSEQGDAPG
ncbi:MAG TPA: hypothetical protein VF469_31915 [Kofleriaceae bacterium]